MIKNGDWGLGIGDWGLGVWVGAKAQATNLNTLPQIPNFYQNFLKYI